MNHSEANHTPAQAATEGQEGATAAPAQTSTPFFSVTANVQRGGFTLQAQFNISPGERIAVMGPSGAGKSTLLKAIAGHLPATTPPLLSAGVPAHPGAAQLLEQNPLLFPHLSAAGNIEFALKARGAARSAARIAARDWLARVGLADLGERYPHQLSGGQQQRVSLARSLCGAPQLLLLDEPFTALDPVTSAETRKLISRLLVEQAVAALIVTHHLADATALATRLILVENGSLTHDASPTQVLENPGTEFAAALGRAAAGPRTGEKL